LGLDLLDAFPKGALNFLEYFLEFVLLLPCSVLIFVKAVTHPAMAYREVEEKVLLD
jgi:uncharacterized protein (DUF302 family)